jgi:hypothetical protein
VVGCCEHGNEPLDSIKDDEFFDHLGDCKLLKNSVELMYWRKAAICFIGSIQQSLANHGATVALGKTKATWNTGGYGDWC